MKVIVGLGNPGTKYTKTRHNAGFWVIDALCNRWNFGLNSKKFQANIAEGHYHQEKVLLVKPETYMNNSGAAVKTIMDYWKVDLEDLFVVYDDLSLPPAKVRLRARGTSGGHKGIQSIITWFGSEDFARLKIGIGSTPEYMDTADYVLASITKQEERTFAEAVDLACEATESWIVSGIEQAMNLYNSNTRNT